MGMAGVSRGSDSKSASNDAVTERIALKVDEANSSFDVVLWIGVSVRCVSVWRTILVGLFCICRKVYVQYNTGS